MKPQGNQLKEMRELPIGNHLNRRAKPRKPKGQMMWEKDENQVNRSGKVSGEKDKGKREITLPPT